MAKRAQTLTAFGKDLDELLQKAGKSTIREYADECGLSYKYITQLRTKSERHPGGLYADLLKPFTRLKIIGLAECHQMSLRHRGKPLSFMECKVVFPELPEQELVESIRLAVKLKDQKDIRVQPVIRETPPTIPSSLYRRVFVGRETELNQLRSAFDCAVSGQGGLMMVVGEPGIGKTALCEQLANYVNTIGGKTLTGHCYSEKSLSLPYLAFVELFKTYVAGRENSELRKELGTAASEMVRIIPEIQERLKVKPRLKKADPEEEKYRLFEAATHFMDSIAATQPFLIILEDLHNADKGTLEMLTYVSRNLAKMRLLLLGTYRDVEVDRTHPLSAALAELGRLPAFGRVQLRGLTTDEVKRVISSVTGQDMSMELAVAIHKHTEGNPLFVQEVLRFLFEEGLITSRDDFRQQFQGLDNRMKIPDSLRDVIGKRLSSLSESCNRLLAIGAVIGRDFRLDVLQQVANVSDDELITDLSEARRAAMIEERTGVGVPTTYRFAHALFRQTLYEEIIAPRRIQLHQQVARVLEESYQNRLEEHAAELAEHFSQSSNLKDLKKAVDYWEMASKRASDVYAWGEVVRLLEQAIKVQEMIDPKDKAKRCDLLLDLGEYRILTLDNNHVLDVEAPQALALAEAIKDNRRASLVAALAYRALENLGGGPIFATPQGIKWVKICDYYALPGTKERALADQQLGITLLHSGDFTGGLRLLQESANLAHSLGDKDTFLTAVTKYLFNCAATPSYVEEGRRLAEEAELVWRECRPGIKGVAAVFMGSFWLSLGLRQRAEAMLDEIKNAGWISGRESGVSGYLTWAEKNFQIMDGDLERTHEKNLGDWLNLGEKAPMSHPFNNGDTFSFRPAVYLGKANEALKAQDETARVTGFQVEPVLRAFLLAHAARYDEAYTLIEDIFKYMNTKGLELWLTFFPAAVVILETAVLVRHTHFADIMLAHLKDTPFRTTGYAHITCVPRHLGGACALLGRHDEAQKYYQDAIKVCTEIRFRPELALSRLQLAELLLEHYPNEKKEAVEHLDFAIKEFREMKMQPSLEKALRHMQILRV